MSTPLETIRLCSIEGCENIHEARGWCHAHYRRWLRTGTVVDGWGLTEINENKRSVACAS